uniref:Reverse transcriptase domain-containing protein n=1 Tax=Tanacetum cinerariifolium TaxID=118510 RepID=A0A699H6G0_TANCI|nr:reverse transcriptase domain-containing protein [Tanacetum cinerariifolium]
MGGRKFTRMEKHGTKLSKIDRILMSHHFTSKWPNVQLIALPCDLSDHCPLMLKSHSVDCLIPFKFFNSWVLNKDLPHIVSESWSSYHDPITLKHPTNIVKKKLQTLKHRIKNWRNNVCSINDTLIRNVKTKVDILECKAETSALSSLEIEERLSLIKQLEDAKHIKRLDLMQKAKIKWAIEGMKTRKMENLDKRLPQFDICFGSHEWVQFKIERGLRQGIKVGSNKVDISHLQYADDALIIGTYNFSLSKAPKCVINYLEKLRRTFFWGGYIDRNKMAWVSWKKVLRFSPSAKIQAIIPGPVEREGPEGTDDREETHPSLTKEHIEGHVSTLKSLVKSHNRRNKGDPIRLDFKLEDTEVQDHNFVKGREVIVEDLRKPFKEARRMPPTRRIIEFMGPEYKMLNNIKLYNGTTNPEDHLSRFASAANSGEWPMHVWCWMFHQTLDGSVRGWFKRLPPDSINQWADLREAFAARFFVRRACFKKPHEITKIIKRSNESFTAFKERWTVETGFIMGVPEVMKISLFMDSVKHMPALNSPKRKRESPIARYPCHPTEETFGRFGTRVRGNREEMTIKTGIGKRHVSHGHTKQLQSPISFSEGRVQPESRLEMALESRKLNHLVKDVRRGGRGPHGQDDPQPPKIINVISVNSVKDKNRKVKETMESWMNIFITFSAISAEDVFEEPLIVEAEVEGYLVMRVYVDEGSSVKVMFEHCFEKLNPKIKAGLRDTQTDLVGFAREVSNPLGKIDLEARFKYSLSHSLHHSRNDEVPNSKRGSYGGYSDAHHCGVQTVRKETTGRTDMTGVPRWIIEHALNVNPSLDPVCQKRRTFSMEKSGVVTNEVAEWVKAGIVRPVKYPTNFEAYVDDMVIKNRDEKMLLADISETFDNLKKINMKLNPKKCSFGVEEGKFLGYMVTLEGIRANPRKKKALADLQSLRTLKEIQSLSGKLAVLNQFLAKSAERTPNEAGRNYAPMEKLDLALFHMTRRLRRYFKAHPVKVITDQPIKNILNNTETFGKLAKYAVELGAYNITFIPRNAVKGQVLEDFLSELPKGEKEELYFRMSEVPLEKDDTESWTLFTDGASSPKGLGAGLVLIGPSESGIEYTYALRLTFPSTNNEAKYEALLAGLRIARQMNISNIEVKVDSKLVASQINGIYKASKDSMIKYLAKAYEYASEFKSFSIKNIHRNMNQKADVLSKLASVAFNHLKKEVLVEVLIERSTKGQEIHTIVEEEGDNWMTPIRRCLEEGIWPKDKNKARCLRAKIGQYAMKSEILFKKGYLVPMLRCVGPLQANYVIWEIHMGSCGMHMGPRAVVRKAIKQGYYCPTMHEDAKKRFGLPQIIVTNNGAQLVNDPFKSWRRRFEIHQMNTVVAHPQADGLVERANRSLMEGIKTRLGREKAGWVDELPNVLWAYQPSIKKSDGETPFSLTYGSEVVIPAEIGIPLIEL